MSTIIRELDIAINRVTVKANAVSNYFTLLDWVNYVILLSNKDNKNFTKYFPNLVIWQSKLLYHCLAESNKNGLKVSALRTTRASLRNVFQQKESILGENVLESFIRIFVGSKIPPFATGISLGMVAGVCKRLRKDTSCEVIESSKNLFYDFFIKEIIGSRVRVPQYVMVFILIGCCLIERASLNGFSKDLLLELISRQF
jgi:hypothetical protein